MPEPPKNVPKPQRGDRYVAANIKYMKEFPTHYQKMALLPIIQTSSKSVRVYMYRNSVDEVLHGDVYLVDKYRTVGFSCFTYTTRKSLMPHEIR